jgi:MFS family permease
MLILGNARAMGGVAAGMAVFGLGFGLLFPSAAALVAEATERSERGAAFGIFYAVYSLGVVIGSVLSGALGSWVPSTAEGPFLLGCAAPLLAVPALLLLRRRQAAQRGA